MTQSFTNQILEWLASNAPHMILEPQYANDAPVARLLVICSRCERQVLLNNYEDGRPWQAALRLTVKAHDLNCGKLPKREPVQYQTESKAKRKLILE